MGMAASQARYLGLTARKTNVEYEGQQINQARTALGNQSASLWNQMLGLTIPTVPSITDYTTLQYSFNDGIANYTISDIQSVDKEIDGVQYNKLVTYYFYEDVYKGIESTNSNPQVQRIDTTTYSKNTDLSETLYYDSTNDEFSTGLGDVVTVSKITDDATIAKYLEANNLDELPSGQDLYSYSYTDGDGVSQTVYSTLDTSSDATAVFNGITETTTSTYKLGNSEAKLFDRSVPSQEVEVDQIKYDFDYMANTPDSEIYQYTKNGNVYWTTKEQLENCIDKTKHTEDEYAISSGIDFQPSLYQYHATTLSEKMENTDYAIMDDASGSGRYSNMKLKNMSNNFNLKAEETTNQAAYNDAMNQYNYDLTRYEKQMSDLNAKTSLIQEQDRTLELRLKQLETEQKALVTEMDAVKGVLQKNVESTFGTFK